MFRDRFYVSMWLRLAVFMVMATLTLTAQAADPNTLNYCGGPLQRACTLFEAFPSCDTGFVEIPGCSGDCQGALGFCNYLAPTADKFSHCGGPGQRACLIAEVGLFTDKCDSGATEVSGCVGDCSPGIVGGPGAISMCIATTPCGGEGQRACCIGELLPGLRSCQEGLTEIPGTTGDATCGGSANPLQISSSGTCASLPLASIDEPGINATPSASGPDCSLLGYADLHVHMFAHLAHGGGVLVGKPYDPDGGINEALKQDYGTDLDLVSASGGELTNVQNGIPPECPYFLPNCGPKLFHGDHTLLDDTVGVGTQDDPASNLGSPLFNGWPSWTSTTHQQVYYKWLERAWRGGLRLMSMLAVTNEALCRGGKHLRGVDCADDMGPVDAQLDAAYAFQSFVDGQAGGVGKGWFRIVTTPAAARQVISEGKLAVVLGIEVANLFNCKKDGCRLQDKNFGETDADYVRRKVDEYYDKGVRHVFPRHRPHVGQIAEQADGYGRGAKLSGGRQPRPVFRPV